MSYILRILKNFWKNWVVAALREHAAHYCVLKAAKKIEAKGKGEIEMYFVNAKQ